MMQKTLQTVCSNVKLERCDESEPVRVEQPESEAPHIRQSAQTSSDDHERSTENVDHKSAIDGNLSSELLEILKERTLCQIRIRLTKFLQPRGINKENKPKRVLSKSFECTLCGRTFKRKNYLDLHTEIHLNERNHECKFCEKRFNTKKNLNSHLLTHKYQKKLHKCHQCEKSFAREAYLREHMKSHANKKGYKCNVCGKGFNMSCSLSRHRKIHLFAKDESEESDTESDTPNTSDVINYQKQPGDVTTATDSKQQPPDDVTVKVTQYDVVVKHDTAEGLQHLDVEQEPVAAVEDDHVSREDSRKSVSVDSDRKENTDTDSLGTQKSTDAELGYRFHCDKCNRKFKTEKYFAEHEDKCNVRPIKCDICGQEMKFRDLNLHLRCKHGQRRQFPCKVCGEMFPTKTKMKRHRDTHGVKPYPCETCGKAFSTKLQLEWHRDVHSNNVKYPCEKCDKVFNNRASRRDHMRGHQDTEDWTCNLCGKHLTAKRKIWDHKRTHEKKGENDERKFQCTICGVTFKRNDYLKTHMEGHLDERNYSCTVCDKRFNTKKNVRSHMRTHETVPKYQCDLCGKPFIRKDSFRIHKMAHTNEKMYECDVCGKAFNMSSGLYHHKKIHVRQASVLLEDVPLEIEASPGLQLVIIQEEPSIHAT